MQKLVMDLSDVVGLVVAGGHMDDAPDLIARLLTAAAMIMEDEIEGALFAAPLSSISDRIGGVAEAGRDIQQLAGAAAVIARRYCGA